MIPKMIRDAGTIFSNKKEFSGMCDLLFARIGFAMVSSQSNAIFIEYIVSLLPEWAR